MIEAKLTEGPRPFATRLATRARILAEARAENLLRARKRDPWRWRMARLLWPNFTKG